MKSRVLLLLSLILSASILLAACKKEDPQEAPAPLLGEFYTQDGIEQNSLVCLSVDSVELVAPVSSVTYHRYNHTGYPISYPCYESGNNCDVLIEKFENGAWVKAPTNHEISSLVHEGARRCSAGHCGSYTITFSETIIDPETSLVVGYKSYLPLTAGVYRMRQECVLVKEDFSPDNPRFEAVAYFTVTAPTAE